MITMNMNNQKPLQEPPRIIDGNRVLMNNKIFDSHTVEAQLAVLIDKDNAPDNIVIRDFNEKFIVHNQQVIRGNECDKWIVKERSKLGLYVNNLER